MSIPSLVTDLSTNTASNSPLGSDLVGSPATVDDFFRSIEAIIRSESLLKSWEIRGDAVTYVSGTTFTMPGDQTSTGKYVGGRRLKANGAATIYASIVSASFNGTVTTVTLLGDSGTTLDTSLSNVQLGVDPLSVQILFPAGSYYPLTGGELLGNMTLSNRDVAKFKNLYSFAEYNAGNTGAAISISFGFGQNQKVTVNSATPTIFLKNAPGVGHYQLQLIQDATGGRVPVIGNVGSSSWINNAAQPTFNTAANGSTILTCFWTGSAWIVGSQKVGTA